MCPHRPVPYLQCSVWQVSTLTSSDLYRFTSNMRPYRKGSTQKRGVSYKCSTKTLTYSQLAAFTNFQFRRPHVKNWPTLQDFLWHLSILASALMFKTLTHTWPYWHLGWCKTFIGHVFRLTSGFLYKCSSYTYPYWNVWNNINFSTCPLRHVAHHKSSQLTHVALGTWRAVQILHHTCVDNDS